MRRHGADILIGLGFLVLGVTIGAWIVAHA